MPVLESQQTLVNELAALDRAISQRRKRLLSQAEKKLRCQAHIELVDLPIAVQTAANSARLQPVTRSFVVSKDCKAFRVRRIVATSSAIGTMDDISGVAAKLSLFPMNRSLSYEWQVRDTYTDRAWQSAPLPDLAAASGKNGGLELPRPNVLPAGTIVEVTVMPILTFDEVSFFLSSVSEYSVQFGFIGDEVLEVGA